MKINEIAFIGYPVTDIPRARKFYEELLGLTPGEIDHELEGMPGKFWIEYDVDNVTFAISNSWEPSGASGPAVAFEVDDFELAVERLKNAGVNFISEMIDSPVCRFALITDPDGNTLTIHKRNAKCSH